jgi:hypothetical protein
VASHSHFTIASVDANGNATITVTAPANLTGTGQLDSANNWVYTPSTLIPLPCFFSVVSTADNFQKAILKSTQN